MIKSFTVGFMQENCYVVYEDHQALIIDPGENAGEIKKFIEDNSLNVDAILITHGHFDHIGALDELYQAYQVPVYASEKAEDMMHDPHANLSDNFADFTIKSPINNCSDQLIINEWNISVIATPGHTDGDVCYYIEKENALFTGDTLFKESAGRTDFPTGNVSALMHSMKVLYDLPYDANVYPGHGHQTTLSFERRHNYYMTHLPSQD